jgi:FRG domain
MNGQWIGKAEGSNEGQIVVNIDEMPSHYQGVAYLNEANPLLPSVAAHFRTQDKNKSFTFRANIWPVNPQTGIIDQWENVKHQYGANVIVSRFADVIGSFDNDMLKLSWTTEAGNKGNCALPKSKAGEPSELVPEKITGWAEYKNYVSKLEGRRFLFRGQNKPWRLRTAYHRSGRADLTRFLNDDIQVLHRQLSAKAKHLFNLDNPKENGAFFSLVQHHGYPTPLLDWTYSPYGAAFFAYRGISNGDAAKADESKRVRILVFDQEQWKTDWKQLQMLTPASLHLSLGEFLAIENERMIPQQAASTVTNIDDIEDYIKMKDTGGKNYLRAIDLPIRERAQVVRELNYMGITAGSLFPGLDGACEELKERFFEI